MRRTSASCRAAAEVDDRPYKKPPSSLMRAWESRVVASNLGSSGLAAGLVGAENHVHGLTVWTSRGGTRATISNQTGNIRVPLWSGVPFRLV
jgi:hypothetical protein